MAGRDTALRLGLMPPLTGIVGLYGREISWAGEIATRIVNERGGVLGRRVELVLEDDGSGPETAVPAAERLLDVHGCAAIIGNLLSSSRIAVASQVAARRRVPYLNFSFYEGSISEPFFFHFAALPNQQIDKMVPYMAETFGAKMYFAGHDYEWPRGSIDAAKRALVSAGGEIVGEEYRAMGTEFGPLLERVETSGADVFVPYFAGSDQQKLLTLFTERNLKRRMQVVMGHYDEAMVSGLPPDVREGFYSSNTYFMSLTTEENEDYLARLARHPGVNGIWPHGNGVLTNFGEGTYLCVLAWAKAVNIAGTLEPDAVAQALSSVEVTGPQGRVVMDPLTRHAAVNTYLARCRRDGTFEIVRSFGRTAPEIPARYRSTDTIESLVATNAEREWQLAAYLDGAADAAAPTVSGPIDATLAAKLEALIAGARASGGRVTQASSGDLMATRDGLNPGSIAVFARSDSAQMAPRIALAGDEQYGRLVVSVDGAVVLANDAMADLTGYPGMKACLGRQAAAFWSSDVRWDAIARAASELEVWIGDVPVLRVSGELVSCRIAVQPLRDRDERVVAYSVLACGAEDEDASAVMTARAIETTDTAIFRIDAEAGCIVDANVAAVRELRCYRSELIGLGVEEVFSPAYRRSEGARARALARSARQVLEPHQTAGYRKDGTEFVAKATFSMFESGQQRQLLVTLRNIDGGRDDFVLSTWRATHDPVTKLPNATLIQERVNNALARSKSTPLEVGVLFVHVALSGCRDDARDDLICALATRIGHAVRAGDTVGRTGDTEFAVVCERVQNGEELGRIGDVIARAVEAPVETADASCSIRATVTPVLGRGSALEALRAVGHQLQSSEERYRSLVESSPHGIVECDASGVITLANHAYARMLGWDDAARGVGSGVWEHVEDAKGAEDLRASVARWMSGERSDSRHLVRERRADGSLIDVQIDWDYKHNASGTPIGLVAVVTDVTSQLRAAQELKQLNDSLEERVRERTLDLERLNSALSANIAERDVIERQLRVSEQRFRGIFERAADGILLVDSDQRVFDVNPALLVLLGFERRDLCGVQVGGLIEGDRARFDVPYRDLVAGRIPSFEGELRYRRKGGGGSAWVRVRIGTVRDAKGSFAFAFVLVQDIALAKALEEQRARVTRELDHRVKNNLAGILALLEQSSKSSATKDELVASFGGRLRGMARLHEMLAENSWDDVSLAVMLDTIWGPFAAGTGDRFSTHGPDIMVPASVAMPLGMALFELTMNAAKDAAFSRSRSRIDVEWGVDKEAGQMRLTWHEHAGHPIAPGAGVGTRIVNGLVRHELGGEASCQVEPEGVRWQFSIPLSCAAG